MAIYKFLLEVEYNGEEPYTDEIEHALKNAYPHAEFRVQRSGLTPAPTDGERCMVCKKRPATTHICDQCVVE